MRAGGEGVRKSSRALRLGRLENLEVEAIDHHLSESGGHIGTGDRDASLINVLRTWASKG